MTKKPRMREQKTYQMKKEQTHPVWLQVDAEGKTLGRLAAEIAKILRGKHRPTFTPHVDCGDGVIVINVDKIVLTGHKEARKIYRYHTGFQGGLREIPYRMMKERKPDFPLRHAVKGMVPKTKLGRAQLKRLRIFTGSENPMSAQKAVIINN